MPSDERPPAARVEAGAVWHRYGLQDDPFFTNPLASQDHVRHGIHLFRGEERHTTAEKIVDGILNTDHSVRLIEGPIGCGKTTLTNYVKSILSKRDDVAVFPGSINIDLRQENPFLALVASILDAAIMALGDACPDAYHEARSSGAGLVFQDLVALRGNEIGLAKVLTLKRVTSQAVQEPEYQSFRHWADALESVAASARASGINRIVLHVNNIEQSVLTSSSDTAALFGDLRDVLLLHGYHFVLCATPEFRTKVLVQRKNVLDIVHTQVVPAFTHADFAAILWSRYDDLRIPDADFIAPMIPEHFADLCQFTNGDLRGALRFANQAFVEELRPSPIPAQLASSDVTALIQPRVIERLETMPEVQYLVLSAIAALQDDMDVRQSQIRTHLQDTGHDVGQSAISNAADALAAEQWIQVRRPNPKATYYGLIGQGTLAKDALLAK